MSFIADAIPGMDTATPTSPALLTRGASRYSNSPLTRMDRQSSVGDLVSPRLVRSGVHPPLDDIEALDEYIQSEPSNLVQIFPSLAVRLEEFCLGHGDACADVWKRVKDLLMDIQTREGRFVRKSLPTPPSCQPKTIKWTNVHGEEWEDDFAWLKEKENPEVLKYIEKENEYTQKVMEDTKPLQKLLYQEFVSRIDENEESDKSTLQDGWTYYTKKVAGEEYRLHCRSKDGKEDVYLDENEIANSKEFEDASYFRVGFLKHSADCQWIAYGIDSVGNERHTTYFMDIETKQVLNDRIEGVYEDLEFAEGNTVLFTVLDDHERAYQLKRHRLGTDVSEDQMLYHEEDEMFYLSLSKTCNGKYVLMNTSAQVTSEMWYVSSEDPNAQPKKLLPRHEGIQYTCENHGDYFYILTNEESKNNWLFRIPVPDTLPENQRNAETLLGMRETIIEHRDFVLIEFYEVRRNHLVVFERSNCLQNVRIIDLTSGGFNAYHYISFGEMVYTLWPGAVREEERALAKQAQFDTNILRFTYTSFTQPRQVIDYDMDERTMTVLYEERISGYDRTLYTSRRLFATGVDGTTIPVSIVYRRDLLGQNMNPAQANPCLLHAYGAYGGFVSMTFSSSRLSLLDRGFIYATAHVRGGADMGNAWYEEGKLGKKTNTFLDFCSVAEFLCKEGYTTPQQLAIYGRSAGGLLIGAVVNMRPDLFAAALTEVPFVDVINTMFDSSIPWTAFEYEEWGNPNDKEIYEVMKTYCPYTNVRGKALARNCYPHMFVLGGMNDPRVAFFEPLKFVAKMRRERLRWQEILKNDRREKNVIDEVEFSSVRSPRSTNTPLSLTVMAGGIANDDDLPAHDQEPMLLLQIEDAGHGGNSGQYTYLESLAIEYAFLITALGVPGMDASVYISKSHEDHSDNAMGLGLHLDVDADDKRKGKHRRRKGKEHETGEKEAWRGGKNDRGPNRLFQWVTNLF
ncbi:prolyl oligopeptidase [Gaertneriomyces semiglobifer]|nr:prolyl oligopeptidase [Gaertneriomyces semiglobifer]